MTNINWDDLREATEENKRAADMLIRLDDGRERRTKYDGGWLYFTDSVHTSSNKQSITANTLTHITIDGIGTNTTTTFRRGIPLDVWANSTLQPNATGEVFDINLTFMVSKASSTATYVEVDVNIGAGFSQFAFRDRRPLTKGSGVEDFVFFSGFLPVTPLMGAYGARFFVNPSEDVTIWDKAITIQRTHSP